MSDERDVIVGIDLGTTFSLVAIADERGPRILRDERGEGRLPSVVCLGDEVVTIGWQAREHAIENPRATVYSIKRLIGKGLDDVRQELPHLAYAVRSGPRDTLQVEIAGRFYSPEEVSAAILRALRDRAEQALRRPVRRAVVTVPAYFDDAQRQATRSAGEAAGLEIVRIINEPTAAALAYGIGLSRGAPETVAVYDLGGGTFDLSVLRIEDGVFQVLATCGDTHLGGDDFDRAIIELVQGEVRERFGVEIASPRTKQALRALAEAVKIRLSDESSAEVELDLRGVDGGKPPSADRDAADGSGGASPVQGNHPPPAGSDRSTYRRTIRRGEFEALIEPLVARTIDLCRRALHDAKLTPGQIQQVILVGGSTRIPLVRRRVQEVFGRSAYTALNPDEVVALGAAMQAAVLSGAALDVLLLDVIPLSLGIETMGGAMGKLILRNTTIPCRATETFTTFVDGQTAITLNVLQGERELAADCRRLAEFELRGIPPMPAGIPKVEVEFLVDANGILNVAARELRSGQEASIQVVPNHGLTRDEIERITRESVQFGREDVEAHRRIDLLNQVAFDTHKTEQMLERVGDQLEADERQRIERDVASLRALAERAGRAPAEVDLDELHRALTDFGRGTLRLAELGIREALRS